MISAAIEHSWVFMAWLKLNISLHEPILPMSLKVQLLRESAVLPTYGTPQAAGADLYSPDDVKIPAKSSALVKIGIAIQIPDGFYGLVKARSGLSIRKGIEVGAGVIDSDYRGEVGVQLINLSNKDFVIEHHSRIAQLLICPVLQPIIVEASSLDDTARGSSGFGSTGV